jgi:hypothetical protein
VVCLFVERPRQVVFKNEMLLFYSIASTFLKHSTRLLQFANQIKEGHMDRRRVTVTRVNRVHRHMAIQAS